MATQDPKTIVRFSERLWSDEVARAKAYDDPEPLYDPAYKFSNGREFVEKHHYQDTNE